MKNEISPSVHFSYSNDYNLKCLECFTRWIYIIVSPDKHSSFLAIICEELAFSAFSIAPSARRVASCASVNPLTPVILSRSSDPQR